MSSHDNDHIMARTTSSKPRNSKPTKAKAAGVTKKKARFAEHLNSTTTATLLELMAERNNAKPANATTKARPKAPLTTIPMDVFTNVLATTIKEEPADQSMKEVAVDHSGKAPSTSTKKARRSRSRPRPASPTPSAAPDLFLPSSYLPYFVISWNLINIILPTI